MVAGHETFTGAARTRSCAERLSTARRLMGLQIALCHALLNQLE
jgi:hypothetical protein